MDAQAQDRAHRIGQTRPVLIFRLVSAHTIETKIMQRAGEKRKLEALIIAKGTSIQIMLLFRLVDICIQANSGSLPRLLVVLSVKL